MARITVESALAEIQKQKHYIDVLQNHCEILPGDSLETMVFKTYAELQNVEETYRKLKTIQADIPYKNSREITSLIPKTSIEDKELEASSSTLHVILFLQGVTAPQYKEGRCRPWIKSNFPLSKKLMTLLLLMQHIQYPSMINTQILTSFIKSMNEHMMSY